MTYQLLEQFETTSGVVWEKRQYSSGVRYRNSTDFRVNRTQQAYAAASKHRVDTSNEQIRGDERTTVIYDDDFHRRVIQAQELYGDHLDRIVEWYQNEPEVEIVNIDIMQEEILDELEEKIKSHKDGDPGWANRYDNYHYYISYIVVKDSGVDSSRQYTKSRTSLEGLREDFQDMIETLMTVAVGYNNILVTEWGIQGKVIAK